MSQHSDYQEAFRRIHQTYFQPLRFYAERKTGDADEADFIVTEAFVKLWEKKIDLSDEPGIGKLLYRMVHNACIDFLRRKAAEKRRLDRLVRDAHNDDASEEPAGERHEIEMELMKKLSGMLLDLDELPEKSREALKKLFLEGMSAKDFAKLRGIRITSVHNLKNHALGILRKGLEDGNMRIFFIFF
jgi:RNA polymerase sigma factor (sigma-70 family)